MEEVCQGQFLLFLIEKVISTRATLKNVNKTKNDNLLEEVDSRRQEESILKMKTFHTTKCRAYPHEKLNTSKGVIRSRELTLTTEEEIASALGKPGVIDIRRISIRSWHSTSLVLTRSWRSAIVSSSTSQLPWGASNAKNIDTSGKPLEDDRHVQNAVKRTRTNWSKIAWKKLDVQTADKIIRLTQDLVKFTKKEKEILEVKHKRNVSFLKARKIVGTYMGENSYASVVRTADTTNEDNKYKTLVEKLIPLEANDWPKW